MSVINGSENLTCLFSKKVKNEFGLLCCCCCFAAVVVVVASVDEVIVVLVVVVGCHELNYYLAQATHCVEVDYCLPKPKQT